MSILDRFKTDVGIDLGTANSLVYLKKEGIIFNEPTVIALNNKTGQILAIGSEAQKMIGRTPSHISVIRPLTGGVISDFSMAQEILRYFLKKIKKDSFFSYLRAIVAIPTNLTEVERKSVEDAVILSGASSVYLLEEPIAAGIGAGLEINEPEANMVIDIGGGTSEIAVISMGGVVVSQSLKVAGDRFNEDIIRFVRDSFKVVIGEPTAERIKIEIGSVLPEDDKAEILVSGRDLSTGLPKEIVVKGLQVRNALLPSIKQIMESVKGIIEQTPPELSGDILKKGIYLSGGGSLLKGLDELIAKELTIKVVRVDDPLTCVIRGIGLAVENIDNYRHLFSASLKPINIE